MSLPQQLSRKGNRTSHPEEVGAKQVWKLSDKLTVIKALLKN
jgi:hypothetical protein